MKVPATPPDETKHLAAILKDDTKRKALAALAATALSAPYEHWESFRFRKPPAPFSKEEAWTLTRQARLLASRPLPFESGPLSAFRFSYVDLPAFQRALHEIDSGARGLIGVGRGHPSADDQEVYLQRSLVEEPFSSSVLEGAATTREIARRMIEEDRAPKTMGERMVLNNHRAMSFIRDHRNEKLTPDRILEIHKILTEGTLDRPEMAGALRGPKDDVRVVDDSTDETLHLPPPAGELAQRLQRLCDFANETPSRETFVHPIVRAIVLHFMLAYDHPFVDGNGRCARALFYWLVLKHGYWLLEYISISAVIRRAPVKYGTAFLFSETDRGDLTYFVAHQLNVIETAIVELHAYLKRKAAELRSIEDALTRLAQTYNRRQMQLIQDLMKRPAARYEIASHQALHGVSYLTSRADLERLAADGVLKKEKAGVKSVFTAGKRLPALIKRLDDNN